MKTFVVSLAVKTMLTMLILGGANLTAGRPTHIADNLRPAVADNPPSANRAPSGKQKSSNPAPKAKADESKVVARDMFGIVRDIKDSRLTIQTRTGQLIQVDAATAMQAHLSVAPVVGHAVEVRGTSDASGILHAETILRAKDSPAMWPPDR